MLKFMDFFTDYNGAAPKSNVYSTPSVSRSECGACKSCKYSGLFFHTIIVKLNAHVAFLAIQYHTA